MRSKKVSQRLAAERGFTLIELLVVVLIIGILAAMAIPQYFKVVEKARVTQAKSFVSAIRSSQERYVARNGIYTDDVGKLDITYSDCAAGKSCGMKDYTFAKMVKTVCADAQQSPGYEITVQRVTPAGGFASASGVAARYKEYKVFYNRCTDAYSFPDCSGGTPTNCDQDEF